VRGGGGTRERIERVRLVGWRGAEDVAPRAVVDASGDAIVAWHAGLATETPAARQLASAVFVLQGVDAGAVGGARTVAVLRALHDAERAGDLPRGCALAAFRASGRPGEVAVKLALDDLDVPDGADELTIAEGAARARIAILGAYLAARVPGFGRAFVSHAAPQIGVRESRRIAGKARLERDDVLGARKRADGVARAAWPIELWEAGEGGAATSTGRTTTGTTSRGAASSTRRARISSPRAAAWRRRTRRWARPASSARASRSARRRAGSRQEARAMNLAELVAAAANARSGAPGDHDLASGGSLDYGALAARIDDVARTLRAAGVERGQRVALAAENTLGHVPAAFGILAAGACLVPLAPTLRPAEVAAVLDETDVNAARHAPTTRRCSNGSTAGGSRPGASPPRTPRSSASPRARRRTRRASS
jgi:hypothetical protein